MDEDDEAPTGAQQARQYLSERAVAYRRVFRVDTPDDGDARLVLADLARFCRANKTTFLPDARASAVLEGRREVWLRLQQHLKLDDDTLWRLFDGRPNSTR